MTTVYQKIQSVMADLSKVGIGKGQRNDYDKYNFRGIDDVYNVLAPILSKNGLIILPRVTNKEQTRGQTKNGGAMMHTVLTVEFDFISNEDGSKHTACTVGEAMDRSDKSVNKALTAAYKYLMFQSFCIPLVGNSNDADSETPEMAADVDLSVYKKQADSMLKDLHEGHTYKVGEAWCELTQDEQAALWTAKSKGGFFTQDEKQSIRSAINEYKTTLNGENDD